MLIKRNWGRLVATVALAITGALGLRALLPLLRINSSLCVHPAAGLGEIGLQLHVFSASASCPRGSYLPGESFGAIVQFSFAISILALVAGVVMILGMLGIGLWALAVLRRLRAWLRRRITIPALPQIVRPQRSVAAVLVPVRATRTILSPQSRRGPPSGC